MNASILSPFWLPHGCWQFVAASSLTTPCSESASWGARVADFPCAWPLTHTTHTVPAPLCGASVGTPCVTWYSVSIDVILMLICDASRATSAASSPLPL
eukprot:7214854-Pyramimonas_sp.AAC.1